MIDLAILRKKGYNTKANGDIHQDLTRSTVNPFEMGASAIVRNIYVTEDFVMRPDLISQQFLGDQNYLDVLLKINGISNPFSLDVGDVISIIAADRVAKIVTGPIPINDIGIADERDITKDLMDPKTTKDIARLNELSKDRDPLPSNINKKGDQNIKIKDGKVVFGEDVTSINKNDCPEPISRSRLKRSLIKNNLFG